MPHARQQIREAAGSLLTGLMTTGANVFQSRVRPFQVSELPGLRVYTTSEQIEDIQTIGFPRRLQIVADLQIEAVVKQLNDVDDVIDTICSEVQTRLGNNRKLSIGVTDTLYQGVEINITEEGNQPIAVANMLFAVTYIIEENAPDTLI